MSITVTMLQTRLGEGGVMWTTGNSYSASDAFAQYLISSNLATGNFPTVPRTSFTAAEATALQSSVSGDVNLLPMPMTAAGVLAGTGVAQSVNAGLAPTLAIAKANNTTVAVIKSRACWLRQMDALSTAASRGAGMTLTNQGIDFGTDATINTNTFDTYWWTYADNGAKAITDFSWQGNATTPRTVEPDVFGKPVLATIIKRDDASQAVLALGPSLGGGSWLFDGTAGSYCTINADGTMTLNSAANVNAWVGVSGEGCNATIFLDEPDVVRVYRFTGNLTARRIPSPWPLSLALQVPLGNTGSQAQMWIKGMPAGMSAVTNNVANQTSPVRIVSVDATGINLAAQAGVNANGIEFAIIMVRDMGASHARKAPAFVKGARKSIQLASGYIDCGTSDTLALSGAYTLEFYGSAVPLDETPFVGGAGVNDETGKQHPLIWRSQGADGGSGTISQSWGMGLFAPMNQGVAGWTGCSVLAPSTRFFNLVQNSSGNLTFNPFNSGIVIEPGLLTLYHLVHYGNGVWRLCLGGELRKERRLPVATTAGGPLTADGAWPLSGARTVIGARQRAGGSPEFFHNLCFRSARIYSRGLSLAEIKSRAQSVLQGQGDGVPDFIEAWSADNASGVLLPASRYSANNGTITSGLVIG